MSSSGFDPKLISDCGSSLNADVAGIAVTVASEFSRTTGSFLLGPDPVLLISDVVVNLCFRAFLHLLRCWLG